MDNRVLMWMAVAMIYLLVYQAWQRDYNTQKPVQAIQTAEQAPDIPDSDAPPQLPSSMAPSTGGPAQTEQSITAGDSLSSSSQTRKISVLTDVYDLTIDTHGGNLRDVVLTRYPVQKDTPDVKIVLLEQNTINATALQTGLIASSGLTSPTHDANFTADKFDYELADDEDQLTVTLHWSENGIEVDKSYTFYRGRYNIDLTHTVRNRSATRWSGAQYAQLKGSGVGTKRSMTDVDSYSFVGSVLYDGNKYEKYDLKDLQKNPIGTSATGGWIANIRHHFLSAAVPPANEVIDYKSRTPNDSTILVSGVAPLNQIASSSDYQFSQKLFVGPKIQAQMEETAEGLKLTVDYGMLTVISNPMFWLLNKIHSLVGNWGWAIVLLTVLIKIVFYPLAEKAGRSSAKMRKVAPRLKSIQERYKDDKQAQSRAMMELYKKEKINPASGCLPLLIQMPVFLALYWVLIESVELRQAPFIGWITDLSSRDPYFILPVIMAGAMFVQTKLNPTSPDPTMAKVMMFMPIVMSVFFVFFPAGLVLYWVMNTVLSVAQQWRINKVVERTA